MRKDQSYKKIIFLVILFILVFFIQMRLSLVQNFILMYVTNLTLGIVLLKWIKDKSLSIKSKLILGLIALFIIGSFFYHTPYFIETWYMIIVLWVIFILIDTFAHIFNKRERN